MNIIANIFEPTIFFSLLGILAVLSLLVIFSLARQGRNFYKLQDQLKKESSVSEELTKKIKGLEENLTKISSELALRNQIYEGLVGQYNELEKDSEKLGLEMDELRKKQPSEKPVNLKAETSPDKTPLSNANPA